jgi:hypothetical protein
MARTRRYQLDPLKHSDVILGALAGVAAGFWHNMHRSVSPLAPWPPAEKMRPYAVLGNDLPSVAKQDFLAEALDESLTQVLGPDEDEGLNCFYPKSACNDHIGWDCAQRIPVDLLTRSLSLLSQLAPLTYPLFATLCAPSFCDGPVAAADAGTRDRGSFVQTPGRKMIGSALLLLGRNQRWSRTGRYR